MRRVWSVLVLVLAVTPALAQPAGDARCAAGADFAKRGDLTRAMLYLADCGDSDAYGKLARDTKKQLRASDYAELSIVSDPPGVTITLDTLPGETLTTPATIFVKPGTHVIAYTAGGRAFSKPVETKAYSRSAVILDATVKEAGPAKDGHVSFEEDNAGEQHAGPPPDIKRPSLMKDKYRGIAGPAAGPQLEDPLALGAQHGARPWFGLRVGGGVFDDGATAATVRPDVGVTARIPLGVAGGRLFASARLDWSRRGGSAIDAVDAVGANAGAGYTLLATRALALAVLVQLRGELRFADARDAMTVARAGAGAAAGAEVAIGGTPLTAGLRFEAGLTELVPDVRDRAFLVELGVDWR